MQLNIEILRAIEDAVDALSRLDERVGTGTAGLSTLLRLRSAQAIVAANDRPLEGDSLEGESAERDSAESDHRAHRSRPAVPDGDAAFAALLGWIYASDAREFIVDDPHLRRVALALQAAAERVRGGSVLTTGVIDDACATAELATDPLPDLLDASLSVAAHESWPALLVAADLSAGACGRARAISSSIARAVAPLAGGHTADVFVVAPVAEELAGALHGIAGEARTMRRRVNTYRDETAQALKRSLALGRGGPSAAALVGLLAGRPALTVAGAAAALGLTVPTAGAAVERLMQIEVLREITGRARDRVFVYTPAVTLAG